MIRRFLSASLVLGVLALTAPAIIPTVDAASPKKATARKTTDEKPANATAECNDGSYSKAKTQHGACSSHGGVKTWWGAAASKAAARRKTETTTAPPKGASPSTGGTPTTSPAPTAAPTTVPPTNTQVDMRTPTKSAANAQENATAKCKDGTYSYSKQHRGACSRHGGVAEWYK